MEKELNFKSKTILLKKIGNILGKLSKIFFLKTKFKLYSNLSII